MRRMLGGTALVLLVMAACDRSPTQDAAPATRQVPKAHFTSIFGGSIAIGIPDTLHANASGRCDVPVSTIGFGDVNGEFGDGSIIFTHTNATADTAFITYSQMADVIWPIPASGSAYGVLTDDNFGDPTTVPYNISLHVTWSVGTNNYSGTMHAACVS